MYGDGVVFFFFFMLWERYVLLPNIEQRTFPEHAMPDTSISRPTSADALMDIIFDLLSNFNRERREELVRVFRCCSITTARLLCVHLPLILVHCVIFDSNDVLFSTPCIVYAHVFTPLLISSRTKQGAAASSSLSLSPSSYPLLSSIIGSRWWKYQKYDHKKWDDWYDDNDDFKCRGSRCQRSIYTLYQSNVV